MKIIDAYALLCIRKSCSQNSKSCCLTLITNTRDEPPVLCQPLEVMCVCSSVRVPCCMLGAWLGWALGIARHRQGDRRVAGGQ